jgi:hypothetical protein
MKTVLLFVGILGFAMLADGQTAQTPTEHLPLTGSADSVTRVGGVFQLRGHVQLRRGMSVITADEADMPGSVGPDGHRASVELRGNVSLTLEDNPVQVTITHP